MPYAVIEDFSKGLDVRRLRVASPAGTLLRATNCHVNRGGELEKRKAFVHLGTLPAGTFGLGASSSAVYVWGDGEEPADETMQALFPDLHYQRIQDPSGQPLAAVTSVDFYDGKPYVAAEMDDGSVVHFYDGQPVVDWVDGKARASFTITGGADTRGYVSAHFDVTAGKYSLSCWIQVFVDGVQIHAGRITHTGDNATTAKKIADAITNYPSTPDFSATADGVRVIVNRLPLGDDTVGGVFSFVTTSSPAFKVANPTVFSKLEEGDPDGISSISVNAVDLLNSTAVPWQVSNEATAAAVAAQINANDLGFGASVSGATVTLSADTSGDSLAHTVTITKTGSTTYTPETVTLTGGTGGIGQPGKYVRTHRGKLYCTSGSVLHFTQNANPTEWTDIANGAGFINLATNTGGSDDLNQMAGYLNYLAIASREAVQIWSMDADPDQNTLVQILDNVGCIAPESFKSYGAVDVFFLAHSGIRSLRARDASNLAITADVGTPIDDLVRAAVLSLGELAVNAVAVIEPINGRYWLAIGGVIYVFSRFPDAKISAWTTYDFGSVVDAMCKYRGQVLLRSGDELYIYGGLDDATYDDCLVSADLPFLGFDKQATVKKFAGVDLAAKGTWDVWVGLNPNSPELYEQVASTLDVTYNGPWVPFVGRSTHVSLRLVNQAEGPATISQAAVHYELEKAD